MEATKKEIIERCGLSPSTVKLLEDMDEKTYKEIAREVIFLAKPIIERDQAEVFHEVITPLRDGVAELDKKLKDREADLIEAKRELAYDLFEEIICPMCYRLNPQHATMDNGEGCHYCHEREDWHGLKKANSK